VIDLRKLTVITGLTVEGVRSEWDTHLAITFSDGSVLVLEAAGGYDECDLIADYSP
jgi:hypothetical protein